MESLAMGELAIHGGPKVRDHPMPARRAMGDAEIAELQRAISYYQERDIDPGYQGPFEEEFCASYVEMMGGGYADAVSSGTGSVYVALAALELPKGSEVILSPVTDSGPLSCIIHLGLHPVIADTKPNSYNIGLPQFLEKVTPKTSALLAVHCGGEPLEIDDIVEEAHKRGIKVLEDCSQAPWAHRGGQPVGTFGDIAATSTMYRKSLSAGPSGGLVYTQDLALHRTALAYADRGKPTWRDDYDFRNPGSSLFPALNWNTDELSCAVGIASVRRLADTVACRMRFVKKLDENLRAGSKTCQLYQYHDGFSPFFMPVWVNEERLSCSKIAFAEAVAAEGIDLNPHYNFLLEDWPWAQNYVPGGIDTPNARRTRNRSFNVFLNERYGDAEADDIANAILKVERHYQ
jgi:perosamine synthetase